MKTFTGIDLIISMIVLSAINTLRILKGGVYVYAILSAYLYLIKNLKRILLKRRQFDRKRVLRVSKLRKWGLVRPIPGS